MKKNSNVIDIWLPVINLSVDDLIPYEFNNKIHDDEQINRIANSIKEFWFLQPIVVDKNNVIVVWHWRLQWAKKLGLDKIPCVKAENLSEAQIKKYRIIDNKLNESTRDEENLRLEIEELGDLKFWDTELTLSDFDISMDENSGEVEEDNTDIDELIEEKSEYAVKVWDIFTLGKHRLMCGDSTKISDVEQLMWWTKADMVFTDPPYLMWFEWNVHADGSKSFNAKFWAIKNDKMSREDWDKFILDMLSMIRDFNKWAYYICFYRLGLDYIFRALDTLDNRYKALIIWNKGNHTLSNSDYMSKYEPIVYGWFNDHKFYWDRSNFDIRDIERTKKNDLHPTMKPVALVDKAIKNSSKKWDLVLDLFMWSWTTIIAAEQNGRICYWMELDPKYVEVIIKRYHSFRPDEKIVCTNRDVDINQIIN